MEKSKKRTKLVKRNKDNTCAFYGIYDCICCKRCVKKPVDKNKNTDLLKITSLEGINQSENNVENYDEQNNITICEDLKMFNSDGNIDTTNMNKVTVVPEMHNSTLKDEENQKTEDIDIVDEIYGLNVSPDLSNGSSTEPYTSSKLNVFTDPPTQNENSFLNEVEVDGYFDFEPGPKINIPLEVTEKIFNENLKNEDLNLLDDEYLHRFVFPVTEEIKINPIVEQNTTIPMSNLLEILHNDFSKNDFDKLPFSQMGHFSFPNGQEGSSLLKPSTSNIVACNTSFYNQDLNLPSTSKGFINTDSFDNTEKENYSKNNIKKFELNLFELKKYQFFLDMIKKESTKPEEAYETQWFRSDVSCGSNLEEEIDVVNLPPEEKLIPKNNQQSMALNKCSKAITNKNFEIPATIIQQPILHEISTENSDDDIDVISVDNQNDNETSTITAQVKTNTVSTSTSIAQVKTNTVSTSTCTEDEIIDVETLEDNQEKRDLKFRVVKRLAMQLNQTRSERKKRQRLAITTINLIDSPLVNDTIEIRDSPPVTLKIVPEIIHIDDDESNNSIPDANTPKKAKSPRRSLGDCPVCLEDFSKKEIMSTICGHVYCSNCIKNVIRTTKKCPTCRKHLNLKNIHPLFI